MKKIFITLSVLVAAAVPFTAVSKASAVEYVPAPSMMACVYFQPHGNFDDLIAYYGWYRYQGDWVVNCWAGHFGGSDVYHVTHNPHTNDYTWGWDWPNGPRPV
jgi:hypothetical protein